jgi:Domain of unknown function (DUF4258)
MSDVLQTIQALVEHRKVRISLHGYRELAADDILASDVIEGADLAAIVEVYPDAERGPSVLVLQRDRNGEPLHILWGMPKGQEAMAVLITAYRPDPARWASDFKIRIKT